MRKLTLIYLLVAFAPLSLSAETISSTTNFESLAGRKIVMTVVKDIYLPPAVEGNSNRTFTFNNGNLVSSKLSTFHVLSAYSGSHCELFTDSDREAPSILAKGTQFTLSIETDHLYEIKLRNVNFRKNYQTSPKGLSVVTCKRGYTPMDERGASSPINMANYSISEFSKEFGGSLVLSEEALSIGDLDAYSESVENSTMEFKPEKKPKFKSIVFQKDMTLNVQKNSGWDQVYNNKHFFQDGRYLLGGPFENESVFRHRYGTRCYIMFKFSLRDEISFKAGSKFHVKSMFKIGSSVLLEGNGYDKDSRKIQFVRCDRIGMEGEGRDIEKSEIESAFGRTLVQVVPLTDAELKIIKFKAKSFLEVRENFLKGLNSYKVKYGTISTDGVSKGLELIGGTVDIDNLNYSLIVELAAKYDNLSKFNKSIKK